MKKTFICLTILLLSIALFSSCSSNESNNGTSGSNNTQHAHAYSTKVIAATCSEQGYTLHTCPCGDVYKDNYKDALGHSWISGEKNYYCSRCNKSEADGFSFHLATMDGESCYTITNVSSNAVINGILEVPRKYESLPVRGIMNWAFSSVTMQVKKLIIHDNIKNIFSDIWHGTGIWTPDWDTMSTLEEIVFDKTCSGMRIEAGAFNNCPKLSKANIKKGMIMYAPADAVTTQNGGTGEYLFKDTPYFKNNATIKNGLYYIADLLLYANLNEVNSSTKIDEGTVFINPCIFNKCTFLKSIYIPSSVLSIGKDAFNGCLSLESIIYNGTVEQFNAISVGPNSFGNLKAKSITCNNGSVTRYYYNGYTYTVGK